MRTLICFIFCLALGAMAPPAHARLEEGYSGSRNAVATPWYVLADAEAREADIDFIRGMQVHHEGALSMSEEYLKSSDALNSRLMQLAKGIIHNQTFEIGLMREMALRVTQSASGPWQQVARHQLAQQQRFAYAPAPGFLFAGDRPHQVSVRDVQFAKAMIIHHKGALDMCDAYTQKPNAQNGYLKLLCVDIHTDQSQEIDLMHRILEDFDGDISAIHITPDMVHGMAHHHH